LSVNGNVTSRPRKNTFKTDHHKRF
jgi:hypothetical protein